MFLCPAQDVKWKVQKPCGLRLLLCFQCIIISSLHPVQEHIMSIQLVPSSSSCFYVHFTSSGSPTLTPGCCLAVLLPTPLPPLLSPSLPVSLSQGSFLHHVAHIVSVLNVSSCHSLSRLMCGVRNNYSRHKMSSSMFWGLVVLPLSLSSSSSAGGVNKVQRVVQKTVKGVCCFSFKVLLGFGDLRFIGFVDA